MYGALRRNREGVDDSTMDEIKQHYLEGTWADGTLEGYNSAIVKYLRFAVLKGYTRSQALPATKRTVWCAHSAAKFNMKN